MKRYMMLVNFDGGTVEAPMDRWKPEEVEAHMDYYRALNKELRETGELVDVQALAGPDLATGTGEGPGAAARGLRRAGWHRLV